MADVINAEDMETPDRAIGDTDTGGLNSDTGDLAGKQNEKASESTTGDPTVPKTTEGQENEKLVDEGTEIVKKHEVKENEDDQKTDLTSEHMEGEQMKGDHSEGEHIEREPIVGESVEGEHIEGDHTEAEPIEGEHIKSEHIDGEHIEGEHIEGEHIEGEHIEGEHIEDEHIEGEHMENETEPLDGEHAEEAHSEGEETVVGEGEELMGEEIQGEQAAGEVPASEAAAQEEVVEEESQYIEEPPPDPAAPYNFRMSLEATKEPFEWRPEQLAEIEQLWELYQNYTPAYTDIDGYITEKELVYMLKALLLMTYTPEQLQELIDFCVRPPHPKGHITYDQFLNMVTLRQRDVPIEESLRSALCVLDPDKTGAIDREYFKEVLAHQGHKMLPKQLDNFVKEIDLSNDGTIGIEDVVGTLCIDLNQEDLIMLRESLFPTEKDEDENENQDESGDD